VSKTRYFVRSRHLAARVAGKRVNIAFREMTAEEAEPHLRTVEKKEKREAELNAGCIKPKVC
jgi:hypothetical protein